MKFSLITGIMSPSGLTILSGDWAFAKEKNKNKEKRLIMVFIR
ncbi:MAG: hypothetical protein U5Q03_03135 [Bacteroidota bacterium]|nr:hypothetical protein [Bacteroidota bacterium]